MIKTIKINDIINSQLNENNYFLSDEWDIEPKKLYDEWSNYLEVNNKKIMSSLNISTNEVTFEEIDIFYKIFVNMMIININEFLTFYINEIMNKFKQNNEFLYNAALGLIRLPNVGASANCSCSSSNTDRRVSLAPPRAIQSSFFALIDSPEQATFNAGSAL